MRRFRTAVLVGALALAQTPVLWGSGTGSVTGTVTDTVTGARLAGVTVTLYTCSGRYVTQVTTNTSGVYTTPATLDTGWYLLRTRNVTGHVNEVHRDLDCVGDCDVIVGSPVWVSGAPRTVNFTLRPGGRISGTVRNRAGTAMPDVDVEVYDAFGTFMTGGTTDASGLYRTNDGLLTGTYHVLTGNRRQLIEEIYNDIPCPFQRCDVTLGTAVPVTVGLTTAAIDFALDLGGRITGTVVGSSGAYSTGTVTISDADGPVTTAPIGPKGRFTSDTGLVTGTYYARTNVYENDIDETWDRAPCPVPGRGAGRPIAVTTGGTTSGINFTLARGGRFEGRVTDRDTSLALHRASVSAYNSSGTWVNGNGTNMTGDFSVGKLCTGSYYVLARGPSGTAYVPEVFRETTCSGCSPTSGTPIAVTAGALTGGIHFKPALGSRIAGNVFDAATRFARKGLSVSVYNTSERFLGSARVDCHGNGSYLAPENEGLPAGDYLVTCSGEPHRPYSYGYRLQAYEGRDCAFCDLGDADRVAVAARTTRWGINFDAVRSRRNGDYDRDGKGDLALFHPDTTDWVVRHADGTFTATPLGVFGTPVPGDYDGDGKTDPSVYDAEAGRWYYLSSEAGTLRSNSLGGPGVVPTRGDFTGDGWWDMAVYDGAGRWYLRRGVTVEEVVFGAAGQIPVPADYDGDEKTDLALYDPASGLWMMRWSRNLTVKSMTFGGGLGEVPVTGDFDGDGRADLATFKSSSAEWRIRYSSDGRVASGVFGTPGDVPVPLDYDGDGLTDLVTYGSPSGRWHVAPSRIGAPFSVDFGGGPMLPQN